VLAGPGVHAELAARGVEIVDATAAEEPDLTSFDTVVVGFRDDFTWDQVRRASGAVRNGARFIATGTDPTLPTPDGPVPGAGALVASVAVASGVEPTVAGKPHETMADLIRSRVGPEGWMVGDRPDTDGTFARVLGYGWALVLTGVTGRDDLPVDPATDVVEDSLATFADRLVAGDLPLPGPMHS
jgi:4-nitrophenyl phosphatase